MKFLIPPFYAVQNALDNPPPCRNIVLMVLRKNLSLALAGIILVVAAVAFFYAPVEKPIEKVSLSEGSAFSYETSIEDISGKKRTLDHLRGKVILLNFWATWCAPCLREMPALYQLQEKERSRGLVIVAISMDNDAVAGEQSLRRLAGPAPFEIFKGQDSAISELFPIEGLPYSVIIDKGGKVQYARAGEVNWAKPDILKWIEKLL